MDAKAWMRRSRRIAPVLEQLEARHLLAAGVERFAVDAAESEGFDPISLCPDDFALGAETLRSSVCFQPGDFNLDGKFDSADFVLALQTAVHSDDAIGAYWKDAAEFTDLAEAMQASQYESTAATDPDSCCADEETFNADDVRVYQQQYDTSDGQTIHRTVAYGFRQGSIAFRVSRSEDLAGHLRAFTFDSYQSQTASLRSRTQKFYDAQGLLQTHSISIYDVSGTTRRTSTAAYFRTVGPVYKANTTTYFNADGAIVSRSTHFYDRNLDQLGMELQSFKNGMPERSTSIVHGETGKATVTNRDLAGTQGESESNGLSTAWSYVVNIRDAHDTAVRVLAPHYQQLLRMNRLPAQKQLETILSQLRLTGSEADRYRNLDLYFRLTKDLAQAMQDGDFSGLYDSYQNVIDSASGDWQPWFRDFARQEGLTIPFAPLKVASLPVETTQRGFKALATNYRKLVGPNPQQYFQQAWQGASAEVSGLMESMRKVRAQIKMLEYSLEGRSPIFDIMRYQNKPDLKPSGIQAIKFLTSWYFFAVDDEGEYILDEPNEAVIRQRVQEKLTDENILYVLDIERWPLDGDPSVVEASLAKLKRTAQLIHKYNPNLLIGYYSLVPERNPNAAYDPGSDQHREWQARNDLIAASLEDAVDIFFPSLYVLHLGQDDQTTEQRWELFAAETIRETRRIADGKPVLPFLAMYYHPNSYASDHFGNVKGWQWLEPEVLLYQLMTVHELADGMVLYNDRMADWQTIVDAELWAAIQKFRHTQNGGRFPQLRNFYDQVAEIHHDERVERLEAEKQLGEKIQDRRHAKAAGDQDAEESLTRQIAQLQGQIGGMFDLWDVLRDF
jgi:hypothetical protein